MSALETYSGFQLYFGDIHNHCGLSYGRGRLDEALHNARLQLDFASPNLVEITSARPSTISKDRYNALSTLYFNAVHSILTGEEDAEVALELLELDIEDLLGE